ncbi:MAG: hypothetical protein KZQ95_22120, partial [Candidatus Thiodiazotropha sp. (ex Epidulcina cf. delphinae)]|nr:hypothetical protein [Candidatus Thiodiazotropha sp. (ex Epidulcina cf. delphinae)]
ISGVVIEHYRIILMHLKWPMFIFELWVMERRVPCVREMPSVCEIVGINSSGFLASMEMSHLSVNFTLDPLLLWE